MANRSGTGWRRFLTGLTSDSVNCVIWEACVCVTSDDRSASIRADACTGITSSG
jgi:hypothetical protein